MVNRIVLMCALLLSPVMAFATVTGTATSASFTCTGSTGPYSFTFPIDTAAAMTVTQNGAVLSSSAYAISPVNNSYDNGGSVTLNTACPSGQTLVLQRVTPVTQLTQFTPYMPALYADIEDGLDQLTEIDQELYADYTTIKPACGTVPIGIPCGGTGATTAAEALANLGGLPLSGGTLTGALNGTSATFSGTLAASAVNGIYDYCAAPGMKCSKRYIQGVSVPVSSTAVTVTDSSFTALDVGRYVTIVGAGANYTEPGGRVVASNLVTTIASVVNANQAILATPASTAVSGSVGSVGDDDTAAFNNLLATVAVHGGIISGTPGKASLIAGGIIIPYSGTPNSTGTLYNNAIRFIGGGSGTNNATGALPGSGFTLDLIYVANGTPSMTNPIAKVSTYGMGTLEWEGTNFEDTGTGCTPFVYTTNTTLQFHNNSFQGEYSAMSACNDAFILGGTDDDRLITNGNTTVNSAFQGYGSDIHDNTFGNMRRIVVGHNWANNVFVRHNNIGNTCGNSDTTDTLGEAISWKVTYHSGGDNGLSGNIVDDNLIEATNYVYGIVFGEGTAGNHAIGDSCWDTYGKAQWKYCVYVTGGAVSGLGGVNLSILASTTGTTSYLDDSVFSTYNTVINGTNGLMQANIITGTYSVTSPIINAASSTPSTGQVQAEAGDASHTGILRFIGQSGTVNHYFGYDSSTTANWVMGTGTNGLDIINPNDSTFYYIVKAGTTADQETDLDFEGHTGAVQTQIRNWASGYTEIDNVATGFQLGTLNANGDTVYGNAGHTTYINGTPLVASLLNAGGVYCVQVNQSGSLSNVGSPCRSLVATLTTTAATSDNVSVTGMTASGHCSLTPTNASASTNIATTYMSAKTTNQITVTHTATASMTYDVICTPY